MSNDVLLNALAADWEAKTRPEATSPLPRSVRIGKRGFDVMMAGLGLLVCAPIMAVVAVAVKLDSPGPVFYRQLRVGETTAKQTRLFHMIKFRSMGVNAEAKTGAVWAQKNDPRVTRVGRFLRKTRLDELPQFINVLRGEMSIIGPRPERPGIVPRLENSIPFYAERVYSVRPGITGLAQVSMDYDETVEDTRCKVGYDHAYALALTKFSSWLATDASIAVRTVFVMLGARGR